MLNADFREEQAQEVINLRDRSDCALAAAASNPLFDRRLAADR
jgi:hypothetical protein